jgi:hypothetical protein
MGTLDRWLKKNHRFALAIADTHVLHACGLSPRGWETNAGNRIELNRAQNYLIDCFDHLLGSLPKYIDSLFLVGDMMEGKNFFDGGVELSEVDENWQVRGAEELFRPLVDRVGHTPDGNKSVIAVSGSKYHGRKEGMLLRMLDGQPKGKHYAPFWREFRFKDNERVQFDLAHSQGYFLRYKSTSLAREIGFKYERQGRIRGVLPEEVVIIRAHVHQYGVWMERGATCVSLPAFKVQDDFAKGGRTPNRTIPDTLGAVGFKVYNEPVDGKLVHVIPYLYDHPDDEPEVI